MSRIVIRMGSFLVVFGLVVSAFYVESRVSAANNQNANSSTTTPQEESNSNMPATRGRRGRRASTPTPPTPEPTEPAEGQDPAELLPTEQTDLSGSYNGTFECSDAGVSGETTLTVNGNSFTLTDGKTGRIVAATTRGYTGVTMQFGDLKMATAREAGVAPVIVSMRAKKAGDRLTLTPIPNARRVCTFTPKR